MPPFGILTKEQLTSANLEGFFNSRQFIALDLYNSLDDLPQSERDKIQERMLGRLCIQNGTFKYTSTQRFDDFDRLCLSSITSNFPADKNICVHDIGVSDGRTSCDLYRQLNWLFGERLDFLASDCTPHLYVLKKKHRTTRLIIDDEDHILQVVAPPFVLNVVRTECLKPYSLSHLTRQLVAIAMLYTRPLLEAYKGGSPDIERTRLELLCPECRAFIAQEKGFHFESYDVLSGPKHNFDIIRVMNLLNHCYFPETQLRMALGNIIQSLNDGGLFITGSNIERGTTVNGGIYKKKGNHMERLKTSGAGSQVDALVITRTSSEG
jgi:hypothetical protein